VELLVQNEATKSLILRAVRPPIHQHGQYTRGFPSCCSALLPLKAVRSSIPYQLHARFVGASASSWRSHMAEACLTLT